MALSHFGDTTVSINASNRNVVVDAEGATIDYTGSTDAIRIDQGIGSFTDRVAPIFLDRRGNQPEIIEVIGLDYDETRRPLRTVGYVVEKVAPEPEELQPEHDADDEVMWIRVTGDKPIEQEGEH